MDFLSTLQARPIVADGAMGTLLFSRGVARDACLEELCASAPEMIQAIHGEYLAAGAEVIRTHSFGSNHVRLARFGYERRVGELNWLAARVARESVKGTKALVAASVGPSGLPPDDETDRVSLFMEHMGGLLDGGADFVILETFTDLAELRAAIEAKQSLHHCPVVAMFAGLDPQRVAAAFSELREAGADVVGINCAADAKGIGDALAKSDLTEPVAAFPGLVSNSVAPEIFAHEAEQLIDRGVRLIGGCCGTTPAHIAALAERLKARLPE